MIQIKVKRQDANITGFHIEGHSGYAQWGSDIICSAISTLAINCANSIEEFTDDLILVSTDEESGMLDLDVKGKISSEALLLLQSAVLGMEDVARQCDYKYVRIIND